MTILTIARTSLVESIRQPVFAVLVLVGTLALVLNVALAAFTLDDDNKLLVDLGLSTMFVCGLLLAAFTATSVLTREIENRTIVTVVSKPVPRPAVILGKYLGVATSLAVGFWTLVAVFLLTVRHRVATGGPVGPAFDGPVVVFGTVAILAAILVAAAANYLRSRSFSGVFVLSLAATTTLALVAAWSLDTSWRPQNPAVEWNPQVMLAVTLIFEAVLVLAAVAIAASTRLGQTMTLVASVGVFLAGLVGEYFLGTVVGGDRPRPWWVRWVAWPAYAALPNMQFFWLADALTQAQAITPAHCAAVTLYATAMILAFLSLAVILFQDRDVG
jgi:ABC-2 type transport system permease protein